ncbi:hypothetical protein pb186bvf_012139 [Paramecium bursaria]
MRIFINKFFIARYQKKVGIQILRLLQGRSIQIYFNQQYRLLNTYIIQLRIFIDYIQLHIFKDIISLIIIQ